jgi:hypothetical protein
VRGASRLAYHFECAEPPGLFEQPIALTPTSRRYRNPISLAQEWQSILADGKCASRADLARQLGVTRARVTQILGLLELAPEVVNILAALGDELTRPVVTERMLRRLLNLPAEEQHRALKELVDFPARASAFQQEHCAREPTPR